MLWIFSYRQFVSTLLLATVLFIASAVRSDDTMCSAVYAERVAAIKLMPSWDAPITLAIATVYQGKIVELEHVRPERFIRVFSGMERHRANPNSEHFFKKYTIPNCGSVYDSVFHKSITACEAVDQLWKLRYPENPKTGEKGGWARNDGAPDAAQLGMLRPFGIQTLHDFAVGEDAWRLLQSMSDPQWQQQYR
jgi:hypothetical protein